MLKEYREHGFAQGPVYSYRVLCAVQEERAVEVPLDEVAYCSNNRNYDTSSIECCHPGEDGQFTQETYDSLVRLTAFLADYYGLERADIIRHYDVTGKLCPLYFVEHEDAWAQFKDDVFR